MKRRTLVELENRSGSSLALKLRAYTAHALVIFRSCSFLRAEKRAKFLRWTEDRISIHCG